MSTGGLKDYNLSFSFPPMHCPGRKNSQDCLDTKEFRPTAAGLGLFMIMMTKADEDMKGFCFLNSKLGHCLKFWTMHTASSLLDVSRL